MALTNSDVDMKNSLKAVAHLLQSLIKDLPIDQQEKLHLTLARLLEEHHQSPQLTLIQMMKIHQRARKDKTGSLLVAMYNLLLDAQFYLELGDGGRLCFVLLDIGDKLALHGQRDRSQAILETAFVILQNLEPKPWVRDLQATNLLLVVSISIQEGDIRKTRDTLRKLLSKMSPLQVDRLRREDVYKIMRGLIETLRTHDQIYLTRLRKKQTRDIKKGTDLMSEESPPITLYEVLEGLTQTYYIVEMAHKFLRNL